MVNILESGGRVSKRARKFEQDIKGKDFNVLGGFKVKNSEEFKDPEVKKSGSELVVGKEIPKVKDLGVAAPLENTKKKAPSFSIDEEAIKKYRSEYVAKTTADKNISKFQAEINKRFEDSLGKNDNRSQNEIALEVFSEAVEAAKSKDTKVKIIIFADYYKNKVEEEKRIKDPSHTMQRTSLAGESAEASTIKQKSKRPVFTDNDKQKAAKKESIAFENQAFEEIKEKVKPRFESFMKDNPELKDKIDQEKLFDNIVNEMLKSPRNDNPVYDTFKDIAEKKQEGKDNSYIEKEKFGKLIRRFFYVAEKMRNKILTEPKEPLNTDKSKFDESVKIGKKSEDSKKEIADAEKIPKTSKTKENKEKPENVDYKNGVANASSFEELLAVFAPKVNVNVERTEKTYNYTTDQIIETLTKIRSGKLGLDSVPEVAGLKDKVEELLKAEEEKREKEKRIRHEKIEKLKEQIAIDRKEYLEVDYKKNTALERIRKYFLPKSDFLGIKSAQKRDTEANAETVKKYFPGAKPDSFSLEQDDNSYYGKDKYEDRKKNKSREGDLEISYLKAHYDNNLLELQKLLLEDAKGKDGNVSNEELENIYKEFQKESTLTLEDEHDKVRAEQMDGTGLGKVSKRMVWITKKYQNLPLGAKLGLAAALMATGGGLAFAGIAGVAAGSTAASVFLAASFSKRLLGGITSGTGTALALEAWGQKKNRTKIEEETQEFSEKIKNLSEEEKNKELLKRIKETAINYEKYKTTEFKQQDIKQLSAGVLVGATIGTGLISIGLHKVAEYFGWFHGAEHGINTHQNPKSALGMKDAVPAPNVPSHVDNLTVEKGSSFEGTLIKYLDAHREEFLKNHPEMAKFNDGQIAHRLAIDFKDAHPEMEGHLPEYIHAGAKLDFNPLTMQIEINDPQGHGWYEQVSQNDPVSPDMKNTGAITLSQEDIHNAPDYMEELNDRHNDLQHEITETQKKYDKLFEYNEDRQDIVSNVNDSYAKKEIGEHLNNLKEDLANTDNEITGVALGGAAAAGTMKIIDNNKKNKNISGLGKLIEGKIDATKFLRVSLEKITAGSPDKINFWKEIKDKPFEIKNLSKNRKITQGMEDAIREFREIIGDEASPRKDINGKVIETVREWLSRVAKKSLEKNKQSN